MALTFRRPEYELSSVEECIFLPSANAARAKLVRSASILCQISSSVSGLSLFFIKS